MSLRTNIAAWVALLLLGPTPVLAAEPAEATPGIVTGSGAAVGLTARDVQRSAWTRRVRPLVTEELMLPARDDSPGLHLEDQEALERLRRAIADLRQEEKEVFLLRQNGELTYEQIAEIRQAPVGTVKTQMRSALIKLRKVLNPQEAAEPGS